MKRSSVFSLRYSRALKHGKLIVDISAALRQKLWAALLENNEEISVARRPGDSWTDNSDTISEVVFELRFQQGSEFLCFSLGGANVNPKSTHEEARRLFTTGPTHIVFDAVELAFGIFGKERQKKFSKRINEFFYVEECSWRLLQGELLQLDRDFLGASAIEATSGGFAAGQFAGAADEFSTALRAMQGGETKQAITEACKSFESMMKVLVGHQTASADILTKELIIQGYLDDLPEHLRQPIRQSVLMSLPVLRNKLTAHGQGADIVNVPPAYAVMAVQFAAALNNWLLAKSADQRKTIEPKPGIPDDIPF